MLMIVGYRAEVVREFFGDGSKFGVSVEYTTQVVQDGTGRVVALAEEFAGGDPFILSYGDILITPENYRTPRGPRRCGGASEREAQSRGGSEGRGGVCERAF